MSQAIAQAPVVESVRPNGSAQPVKAVPPVKWLTPVVQSGPVDVSDIAALPPAVLRDVLIERARKLAPLLEKNAASAESNRRVADESIAAIRAAGLYKIMVPRRYGGLQTDIRTKLDVSRELARACGSTAWVSTLMNVCAWFAGLASAEAQNDIWGNDPDARVAGVFTANGTARPAEGGQTVSGRWAWASGCLHSDWAMVGMPVVDADGNEIDQGLGFIPMAQLTIEDTWFTVGMRGTGSNTLVAENVFVPAYRIMSVPKVFAGDTPTPYKDEALYRAAFIPVAAIVLAGPQLGLCSRALDYVIAMAPKRKIAYTFYDTQSASPSFQLAMANAATLVDTAHLFAYRSAATIDEAARNGQKLSDLERARVRMDSGHVVKAARDAIDLLMSAHGASSFAEFNPLQRIWRDSETASRHAVLSPEISAEVYGRALLGITEKITPLD